MPAEGEERALEFEGPQGGVNKRSRMETTCVQGDTSHDRLLFSSHAQL